MSSRAIFDLKPFSARPQEYQPLDNDGKQLEPAFKSFFENTIKAFEMSHHHVAQHGMEDWLKERIRKTMIARWRNISCRRDQCASILQPLRYATVAVSLSEAEKRPIAPYSALNSDREGEVRFPAMPEIEKDAKHFACLVCGLMQGTDSRQPWWWVKHVLYDLAPYICMHEECTEPWKVYSTLEDLKGHYQNAHMSESWWCNLCRDGPEQVFETAGDFERHIRMQHGSAESLEGKIEFIIDFSCQRTHHEIRDCRFCGFEPKRGDRLDHHLEAHMEAFALYSLPWDVLVFKSASRETSSLKR
jgi:hypothetical protein